MPFEVVWAELHKTHKQIPDSLDYASRHVLSLRNHIWHQEEVAPDELSRRIVDPDPVNGGHLHPSPNGFRLAVPGEMIKTIAEHFEERSKQYKGDQTCPKRIRQLARDWDEGVDLGSMFFEVKDDVSLEPVIIDGLHRSVAILLSGRYGLLRAYYAYPHQ